MKFKISLMIIAASLVGMPGAQACSINFSSTNASVTQVLKSNGGWNFSRYEHICNKLEAHSAGLLITANNGILNDKSFASVTIGLKDIGTYTTSDSYGSHHFRLSDTANGAEANLILYMAINNAINNWQTVDEALQELEIARRFNKSYYSSMGSTEVAPLKKPKSK